MTYLVYQRTLQDHQVRSINENQNTNLAKAYFGLTFPNDDIAQERVSAALRVGLYSKTMIISATDGMSVTLAQVFDAGNGYAADNINVVSICSHPSMSVGDIAVNLLGDDMFLCMPNGWYKLENISLEIIES